MFRFHDFDASQIPDFWTKRFENPELIKLMSYIHSVLGAKAGGYKLLQGYDIVNTGEHLPGIAFAWEPLKIMSYRYTPGVAYPHSYAIPSNILSIQNIYDKRSDPTLTLQTGIDFSLDEDILGILRLVKDFPTKAVTVVRGNVQGVDLDDDNVADLELELTESVLGEEYGFTYKIVNSPDVWAEISAFEIVNRQHKKETWNKNSEFLYLGYEGLIKTKVKLPSIDLFIAKGTLVGTRLNDDFGKIFGYSRYDSTRYRDTTGVLTPLFFSAPTIGNVKAAANVAFKLPVSKYGDEVVQGIRRTATDTMLMTDKYIYKMYGANNPHVIGSQIDHNSPLSDALTFFTERTDPGWWKDRAPGMFQKYAEDPLTMSRKDRMMDTFLKNYLAQIRLDLGKVNTISLRSMDDVWALMFDGLPIRSDIIISTYMHIYDLDMKMPDFEKKLLRARYASIWKDSTDTINGDMFIPTRTIVKHVILAAHDLIQDWTIGGSRYRIVGKTEQFKQFWSEDRMQTPYVEPCWDRIWHRTVSKPTLPLMQGFMTDVFAGLPETVRKVPGVLCGKPSIGSLSKDRDIFEGSGPFKELSISSEYIAGDTVYDYSDFQDWKLSGLWLGIDGIVCPFGTTGHTISEQFSIGMVPKDITVSYRADEPYGTAIKLFYALGDGDPDKLEFKPVPSDGTLYGVRGTLRVKIELTSNSYNFPNLLEVLYTTRVVRNQAFQDAWSKSNI